MKKKEGCEKSPSAEPKKQLGTKKNVPHTRLPDVQKGKAPWEREVPVEPIEAPSKNLYRDHFWRFENPNPNDGYKEIWLRRRYRAIPARVFAPHDRKKHRAKQREMLSPNGSLPSEGMEVSFFEDPITVANLSIQLRVDSLSRSLFLRSCILGYLRREKHMVDFVDAFIKEKVQPKRKAGVLAVEKIEEELYDYEEWKFNLDETRNLENGPPSDIFDLIASEYDIEQLLERSDFQEYEEYLSLLEPEKLKKSEEDIELEDEFSIENILNINELEDDD